MTTETIDHRTLTELVGAQAVRAAHVVGQPGGWSIVVKYGMSERAVAASRSRQVRVFKKFETLVGYLKDMGLHRFDVDAAGYDAESVTTYRRPDASEALRRAHGAAAYDKWFRAEVQASIDDPRPNVSAETARTAFAAKRDALRARAEGPTAAAPATTAKRVVTRTKTS